MNVKRMARRITLSYSIIQFSSFASSFVIFLYVTVILLSKGFTNTEVGITAAAGSGVSIFIPPIIAAFYARHSSTPLKRVAVYVRIGTFISSILLLFVDSPVLLVSIIFIMISCTTISSNSLTNAIAMEYENAGVPVNYGIARSLGSLGCAGMGYVSGLLSKGANGINEVIALSILLLCVTTFVTLLLPHKFLKTPKPSRLSIVDSLGLRLLRSRTNILFFIVMVLIWANMGVLDTYQIDVLKSVGGNEADFGVLLTVMTLCEVPLMWFFKPLSRRFSYVQLMTAGFVFLMAKDISLIFAPSVTAVTIFQCFNLGTIGLFSPASVYYSNAIADTSQYVQSQALFGGTANAVGRILGTLTGGIVIDNIGLTALLSICVVFALLCIVIMQISNNLSKKKSAFAGSVTAL